VRLRIYSKKHWFSTRRLIDVYGSFGFIILLCPGSTPFPGSGTVYEAFQGGKPHAIGY